MNIVMCLDDFHQQFLDMTKITLKKAIVMR